MRARGFTLIEVMIAVSIVAVMAVMTVGALSQVDRAAELARAQEERTSAARLALSRLSREVTMAFVSDNFDTRRYRERPTLFVGREDELTFTAFGHVRLYRDAKESDQSLIHYVVDDDPEHPGERALFRREKVRIDDEPDRGGRRDLVADRITGFSIQYWDAKRRDWVREWTTRGTEHAGELPPRVRFELEMAAGGGRTEKYVTEARIELRKALN